ncbi:radical SAM protein [Paenibacillus sp. FSL P2-0089]|uniref:radical SAM/SPASM domain-containing protein n=1 Tax=Paenibacillus sp. FSL P2-0089 TaxID=2954526 RepID=UPI00315B0BB0
MKVLYKLAPNLIRNSITDDYYFIYNALYGNGRIVSKECNDFFDGHTIISEHEVLEYFGDEMFNDLIALNFIYKVEEDERALLEKELDQRQQELHTGIYFDRLHLSTTNKCNMSCSYCFCSTFDYSEANPQDDKLRFPQQAMSFEVAKEAIEKSIQVIQMNGKNKLSIEFFGGEPFLNSKLIEEVLLHFGDGTSFGMDLEYGVTTNGSYLPSSILELLAKYKVRVAVSIDYIDYLTGEFRGEGNNLIKWATLDKNIGKLRDRNINIELQSVMSEETWDHFNYELIDYAAAMGIKSIEIIMSFDFDFYRKFGFKEIGDRILDAYDYAQTRGVLLSGYWYQSFWGIVHPDEWVERRAWKTCPTIGRLISIEPDGSAYACKTTSKKLGNTDLFQEIFAGEAYRYYAMRAYSNSKGCVDCELEGFCSGNCTGAVENEFDDIYNYDEAYCKTIKHIVKGLLERYFVEIKAQLPETEKKADYISG